MNDDITVESNVENLELYSDVYPFRLSLRVQNFDGESEYKKFIKNCEKLIRSCMEYRQWKAYIIDILGVNTCMITDERIDECTIEVHHHMPSLYVLVKTLTNKSIETETPFSTFDIAQQAIELHFQNKIGYVTLIKSIHEKFHNGFLNIPAEMVRGDYNYFINNFSGYIDDDDMHSINQRLSINEGNSGWSRNDYPGVLEAEG
ncbi:hypothetical protein KAR91_24935 [Candidatus Pacearchaeota archaeon]|nr:hypothetical protein [Candidatus Pacearchaeota archaeon]